MASERPDLAVHVVHSVDISALASLRSLRDTRAVEDPDFESRMVTWFALEGDRRTTWLATINNLPVGMASLFEYRRMPTRGRPDSRWGYVGNTFVREDVRSQGVGSALDARALLDAPPSGQDSGSPFYYHGRLFGQVKRCGWVSGYRTAYVGAIPSGTSRPCRAKHRLSPQVFARLINCDNCGDGSPVRLRGHSSRDDDALTGRTTIPYWRNVQPGTSEGNSNPTGSIPVMQNGNRTQVAWRYLTRSKGKRFARFALVRAPQSNPDLFGNNKWAFIERRWLPTARDRYGLCDNTSGGTRYGEETDNDPDRSVLGERLDYSAQDAKSYRLRKDREDWPKVCSHGLYGVATPGE